MIFELSVAALMLAFLTSKKRKAKAPGGGTGPGPYDRPDPVVVQPDKPTPGTPSGPKPTPGSGPKPVTPTSPPPGSRIFGTPKGPSSGSIVTGNLGKWGNWIMVAKDCSWVIEGPYLWHLPNRSPSGSSAIEASTLAATLAIADGEGRGGNCITGFIDYLDNEGQDDAQTAAQIVKEAAPMCAAVGPQFWSPQMRLWYENLRSRIVAWRQGIEFGGEKEAVGAPESRPDCDDVVMHDDQLEAARVAVAVTREAQMVAALDAVLAATNPGCNPRNPQMRIHCSDDGKRVWIRRSDFDNAAAGKSIAALQNGTATLNFGAIEHQEPGDARNIIDLRKLFMEGV